jgi:hypothetical protein
MMATVPRISKDQLSFAPKAILRGSTFACLAIFLLVSPATAEHSLPVIVIDLFDDSCQPATEQYATCAEACVADAESCAEVIHTHINQPEVKDRLQLYPTTKVNDPNPTTPMHGLFNTIKVNQPAFDKISSGIANPT